MSLDGNINIRLDGEEMGRNELDYKSFDHPNESNSLLIEGRKWDLFNYIRLTTFDTY